MNGYICLYGEKKYEVYADSTFSAQKICAENNNIPKKNRYKISVMLAEKEGVQVTHLPLF